MTACGIPIATLDIVQVGQSTSARANYSSVMIPAGVLSWRSGRVIASSGFFPNLNLTSMLGFLNMKKLSLLVACLAVAFSLGLSSAFAEEKAEAPAKTGSIRLAGKVAKADRPALAKISFADALKIAQETLPGKVVTGELEVEDGNLQYAFEIVQTNKKIGEVEIDAGNGKILGVDHDDSDAN